MAIPCDLLVFNVSCFLEPRDQLALAMSSKDTYRAFFVANPGFKELYSAKHRCGSLIRRMLEFVRRGPTGVASWVLLCGKKQIVIARSQSGCFFVPGEHVTDVLAWFSTNMWPHRKNIMVSTRCNYKKVGKREEFMALTNEIVGATRS